MNKMKIGNMMVLFLIGLLTLSMFVSAHDDDPETVEVVDGIFDTLQVEVDGTEVLTTDTNRLDLERGNDFVVRMELLSNVHLRDVELTVFVSGYEYNDVTPMSDNTGVKDMEANVTYIRRLHLTLPDDVEEDDYKLRLLITDRNGNTVSREYRLKLDIPRKGMKIEDVVFNPEYEVEAGRSLLTLVRVENTGERDQNGVKVSASIPELRVSASDYIDEVEAGDEVTSEALYMRIPSCVDAGVYNVEIVVTYDSGHRKEKMTVPMTVVSDDRCNEEAQEAPSDVPVLPEKTIITVGPTAQEAEAGNAAVFPVTLTNAGNNAKTYTVSVEGLEGWATLKVSPSNVVLVNGGESKTAYVSVTPNTNAESTDHSFVMTVRSGNEVLQQVPANVLVRAGENVVAEEADTANWDKVKKGLEIGLVVLVVLLVILGLIIAFNKMKNDEDEDEGDAGQTYY